jgi:hypothetical protein
MQSPEYKADVLQNQAGWPAIGIFNRILRYVFSNMWPWGATVPGDYERRFQTRDPRVAGRKLPAADAQAATR